MGIFSEICKQHDAFCFGKSQIRFNFGSSMFRCMIRIYGSHFAHIVSLLDRGRLVLRLMFSVDL